MTDEPVNFDALNGATFSTILADPPWRFTNRTGKVAPEHRRLNRYDTMDVKEIAALPVSQISAARSHLYLWVPNALLGDGLLVMEEWGFTYKANIVWHKIRKDGGPDGRGVGFYFRNVTELLLFGVRGNMRTLDPARSQVNFVATRKREHSRKPDEVFPLIESCSPGPYLELFARYPREGWTSWGNEADPRVVPRGKQYVGYGGTTERSARKPRIAGEERSRLGRDLAERYESGSSVRQLAADASLSIGLARTLLTEAGVEFRPRGGANHRTARQQA